MGLSLASTWATTDFQYFHSFFRLASLRRDWLAFVDLLQQLSGQTGKVTHQKMVYGSLEWALNRSDRFSVFKL
jgi:hypothetical protein